MHKRGQIFLAATIIIIAIVGGLIMNVNSIAVQKKDNRPEYLAKEIKQEAITTMNFDGFHNLSSTEFTIHLETLLNNYSKMYPDMEIYAILIPDTGAETEWYYNATSTTKPTDLVSNVNPTGTNVEIRYDSRKVYYNLPVYNESNTFYVLVTREYEKGRFNFVA